MRLIQISCMGESNERLRKARQAAGYTSARGAAQRFGWPPSTYASHENGQTPTVPVEAALEYGKAFRVSPAWILTGEGDEPEPRPPRTVPLVGHVGAGAQAHLLAEGQGPFGDVPAPEGSTEATVAVEVRGDSLGAFFDQWLIYYDDVRSPVTPDLFSKLCVVGLSDGRILVKKLQRGHRRGYFTLHSQFEPPIYDVLVEWAAKVKNMVPR
jgi:hypothetical protein